MIGDLAILFALVGIGFVLWGVSRTLDRIALALEKQNFLNGRGR